MKYLSFIIISFYGLIASCSYEFPEPAPADVLNPGTANFERIAILGGTQFSGFMDGALYTEGQNNSIGANLANQINANSIEPIAFQQPDVNSQYGYNPSEGGTVIQGKYFIKFTSPGSTQPFKGTNPGDALAAYTGAPLNNFSIPGLRTTEVLDPAISNNPYYQRFAANPGVSTPLDELISLNPTLTIIQLGWDDVLPYLVSGLTGNESPPVNLVTDIDLTPLADFQSNLEEILNRIVDNTDSEIIITNIPDLNGLPFFKSISPIAPINGVEAGLLQAFYREYNINISMYNATAAIRRPQIQFFSDDPPSLWKVVVEDPSLPEVVLDDGSILPNYRQMEDGEYLLWSLPMLPTAEGDGFGTFQPIPKRYFFTQDDISKTQEIIEQFNEVISNVVDGHNQVQLWDCHQVFETWSDNITVDGVLHSYDFTSSGIFSADGLNLNQRGSALLTNQLINLINANHNATIPLTNPNDFAGNEFVIDFD